jgi:hypothetical protein
LIGVILLSDLRLKVFHVAHTQGYGLLALFDIILFRQYVPRGI